MEWTGRGQEGVKPATKIWGLERHWYMCWQQGASNGHIHLYQHCSSCCPPHHYCFHCHRSALPTHLDPANKEPHGLDQPREQSEFDTPDLNEPRWHHQSKTSAIFSHWKPCRYPSTKHGTFPAVYIFPWKKKLKRIKYIIRYLSLSYYNK